MKSKSITVKYRDAVKVKEQFYLQIEAPVELFAKGAEVVLKLKGAGGILKKKNKFVSYDDLGDCFYTKAIKVSSLLERDVDGEKFRISLSFIAKKGTAKDITLSIENASFLEDKEYSVKIQIGIEGKSRGIKVINKTNTGGGNIQGTVDATEIHISSGESQQDLKNARGSVKVEAFDLVRKEGRNAAISFANNIPDLRFLYIQKSIDGRNAAPYWIMEYPVIQGWFKELVGVDSTKKNLEDRFDDEDAARERYLRKSVGEDLPLSNCKIEDVNLLRQRLKKLLVSEYGMPDSYNIVLPTSKQWNYAIWEGCEPDVYQVKSMVAAGKSNLCIAKTIEEKEKHRLDVGWECKPVGQLKPNKFGVRDFLGQVFEVVDDSFDTSEFLEEGEMDIQGASFRANTLRTNSQRERVHASVTLQHVVESKPMRVSRISSQIGYRFVISPG